MTTNPDYQKICDFQGMEIGYIGHGHWAVQKPHVFVELTPAARKNTLSWLPLLEGEYRYFEKALQTGLRNAALDDSAVRFPLHDLLAMALGSHDDHWAQLGIGWAQAAQQVGDLKEHLRLLMVDKRVSQATRHAAKKLLFVQDIRKD